MNNTNTLNEQNKISNTVLSPGMDEILEQRSLIRDNDKEIYGGLVMMASSGSPPNYPGSANEIYQERRLDVDERLIDLAKKVYESNNVERAKHLVRLVSKHYENRPGDLLSFREFDDLKPEQNQFVRGLAKAALSSIADKLGWDVYSNLANSNNQQEINQLYSDPTRDTSKTDIYGYKSDLTDMGVLKMYVSDNIDFEGFENSDLIANQTNNLGISPKSTYTSVDEGIGRVGSGLKLDMILSQPKKSLYEFDSLGEGIGLNHHYANYPAIKGTPEQYFSKVIQKDKK